MSKEKIKNCESCKKHKATYECKGCGRKICGYCADKTDYECYDCFAEPPMYEPIKRKKI